MVQPITVTLPEDVQQALDEFSRAEGIPSDEIVGQAVKQHLFLRQFRSLRERLSAKAKERGIETDEDVFDRVS